MAEEKTELSEPQKEINGLVEKAQKALEDYLRSLKVKNRL